MNYATADQLRAFEERIKNLWEAGDLPFLLHLCGGNEGPLIDIFSQMEEGDWVFSSHRNHYHALLAGIPHERLAALIRTGDSMFVYSKDRNFVTSAILGGTPGIAAGVALALKAEGSKNRVWCFIGDGAEDNGHFAEAVLFVQAHKLPCVFVIEDNNRQVDTTIDERTNGFRLSWPECVRRYHYTPRFPHAGSGCAHKIEFKPLTPTARE